MANTLRSWTPGRIYATILVILGLTLIMLTETVIPFRVGQGMALALLISAVAMPLLYHRRTQHFRSALWLL